MYKKLLAMLIFVALLIPIVSAAPTAPGSFAGVLGGTVASNKWVTLTWDATDTNTACFSYYELYRSTGYGAFNRLTTIDTNTVVTYIDNDIGIGAANQYRLREISLRNADCGASAYGTGAWTSDITVTNPDATSTDVGAEILNLIYVIFSVLVKYMPIILILAIASGIVLIIGKISKSAKGMGTQGA